MYLLHMYYTCFSIHVIHLNHHSCITGVAQLSMYTTGIWLKGLQFSPCKMIDLLIVVFVNLFVEISFDVLYHRVPQLPV